MMPMHGSRLVTVDPPILGGTPVFTGTRVPIASFYDYLKAGESIQDFLIDFPSVEREAVLAVLKANRLSMTLSHG